MLFVMSPCFHVHLSVLRWVLCYSCIPSASSNAISAFAAAVVDVASPSSCVAPAAIADSLAILANVATTPAFNACRCSFACQAGSCLCAAASSTANIRSVSRFAFISRCCCSSSSVDGWTVCHARFSVSSCACFCLSGSCLSSIASISGVSVIESLSVLSLELNASEMDNSLTLSFCADP